MAQVIITMEEYQEYQALKVEVRRLSNEVERKNKHLAPKQPEYPDDIPF